MLLYVYYDLFSKQWLINYEWVYRICFQPVGFLLQYFVLNLFVEYFLGQGIVMDRSYWSYYAILNILRDFGFVSQDGKSFLYWHWRDIINRTILSINKKKDSFLFSFFLLFFFIWLSYERKNCFDNHYWKRVERRKKKKKILFTVFLAKAKTVVYSLGC